MLMTFIKWPGFTALGLLLFVAAIANAQDSKLWYKQPAKVWTDALPIGNGRLGGMVFGRIDDELIQLNEATLWSGGPVKQNVNPGAFSYLAQVRAALFKGDYQLAKQLTIKMQGLYSESYLPLGDLHIKQNFSTGMPTAYYRDLDIKNAIATTRYTVNGVHYKREVFASAPDQVIAMRITASKAHQINLNIATASQLHYYHKLLAGNVLALKGKAPSHVEPNYVRGKKTPISMPWNAV
jgi:alpha-L-fucosidase 2